MALNLKLQLFFFGRENQVVHRLKHYEKQSAKMYRKISGVKLQRNERMTPNQLVETFRGHTISQAKEKLTEFQDRTLYVELLCWHWKYDPDCPSE